MVLEPKCFSDNRGFFLESFELERYRAIGVIENFVQDNHSRSLKNVLRGLHFTRSKPQAQIVTVIRGRVFDVVVDVRAASPTFGRWFGTELCDEGPRQIYMAPGFAHGFCVLSEYADLHYKVSQHYDPKDDAGLFWNDPGVGIKWPVDAPIVSDRDNAHPRIGTIAPV
ncbi:MAG: dTDP-4-dehydrorhamnose 3,5-epimerase [Sulfuritalea sp.]|nr:dTDP-4-dehydrorhamnose 3,5-epimerase [Sulfuritalea sp.]